jgi:radical SAM superfamily enzyme YgiQ (UPF0313 family)
MLFSSVKYNQPVFRPPAEAYSAIVQVTLGCSWNKCAFCEMYTTKQFKSRNIDDIKNDIRALSALDYRYRKVFLADGDAFVLSASKLLPILEDINKSFKNPLRISAYALPKNILSKTNEELVSLRENGLKLLYIGIESGDDELLRFFNKGETYKSTVDGIKKAHNAGFDTSVMIINGLGGKLYSEQHALNSAKLINEINPKFLSTLTLSFHFGSEHFSDRINFDFRQQTVRELLIELKMFIEDLNVENVIFRSNHVSNNLALKATLSKDKQMVISQIEHEIQNIPAGLFPPEAGLL